MLKAMSSRQLAVLLLAVCLVQSANCFGISSFGKAQTDPPKPLTTTASPGKTFYMMRLASRRGNGHAQRIHVTPQSLSFQCSCIT